MRDREKRIRRMRRIVSTQPLAVTKGRKSRTTEYAEETEGRRLWPGVGSRERRVSFAVFASFAIENREPRIGRM